MRFLPTSLALALVATIAGAQEMRPQEAARLAEFDLHFGRALRPALAGGARGDVDLLQEALAGEPLPPLSTALSGDWRCRMLKLGGDLPLVAYAPFDCRITQDGDGYLFEKLTGSQRMTGRIALRDGRMIYLGTGFVADATPTAYADLAPDFAGDGTIAPQVALVEQPSPDRARLLLPAPVVESAFDVLYLTR